MFCVDIEVVDDLGLALSKSCEVNYGVSRFIMYFVNIDQNVIVSQFKTSYKGDTSIIQ